jgi:hypothetical protein
VFTIQFHLVFRIVFDRAIRRDHEDHHATCPTRERRFVRRGDHLQDLP